MMIDAPIDHTTENRQNTSFPPLYTRGKNAEIRVYYLIVEELAKHSLITSQTGVWNGKLISKSTRINKGKNIGKANETTHYQQALNEGNAMYTKKHKEGYKNLEHLFKIGNITIEEEGCSLYDYINKYLPVYNTDHNGRSKPMLADKWASHKNKVKYPVLVQPKYNGVRCKIGVENGQIITLSREGEVYDVTHITKDAKGLIEYVKSNCKYNEFELDGELYVHGLKLQDIASLVKTSQPDSKLLKFICYDAAIPYLRQRFRNSSRNEAVDFCGESILITEEYLFYTANEVMTYCDKCIKNGYEGVIVRDLDANYMFSFRDKALLKIKETVSAEFEIVGIHLNDGHPIEDFVWICKTPKGKSFEVKPHGNVAQRCSYYELSENYIGQMLQLSFYEYTKDLIPFHITEVTIRNYE